MTTVKDSVIEIVKKMPDSATLDDIVNVLKMKNEKHEHANDAGCDIDVTSVITLSHHALKPFLENEPDIYTDADLKVKYT
nr:hypothetical protein [Candidatus Sigynarchaeota archaeon]